MKLGQIIPLRRHADAGALAALTDQQLAALCASGDAAAQSLVFARHAPTVRRFLGRMCGGRELDADDLLQLAFLAAFGSIGNFRGARLSSWLFGVAANVVRAQARQATTRRRLRDAFAETIETSVSASDADLPRLRAAIEALPHAYREIVVLVDLEGERAVDVAVALRISEGTVWARLAKARARLKQAMGV